MSLSALTQVSAALATFVVIIAALIGPSFPE